MQYNPGRDFRWLLLRPWVFIPRLIQVLWTLGGLVPVSYTHLTLPTKVSV